MELSCIVLERVSPDIYAEITTYAVEVGTTARAVAALAQGSFPKYRARKENWHFDIEIYQPRKPSGPTVGEEEISADWVLDNVNDKYLKERARLYHGAATREGALNPRFLIAIVEFTPPTEYIIFERADKVVTSLMGGRVSGKPSEIVGLVLAATWEVTESVLEAKGRGIVVSKIFETKYTREEILDDETKVSLTRTMTYLNPAGVKPLSPSGSGCLYVEITTEKYINLNYFIFRKEMGNGYKYIDKGSAKGLHKQTLKVVEDKARSFIGDGENARISISKLKTDSDLETMTLTDQVVGDEFTPRTTRELLNRISKDLLIILVPQALNRPLETIYENNDRKTAVALARTRDPPSTGSKHSSLLNAQRKGREDVLYNNRPPTLVSPPVQIYSPAFAMFLKEMSRPCDTVDFTNEELEKALDFIDTSLVLHNDEAQRRTEISRLRVLGRLESPEIAFQDRTMKPDGIVTTICHSGRQEATIRLVEMKNEIGEGGSDPIAQAECGFRLICSSDQYELFRSASCCPMFLVGVAGPHLTVSGAIFTEKFISQRLTDYIYIGPLPTFQGGKSFSDHSARRVAQVLRALDRATEELGCFYTDLKFIPSPTKKPHSSVHRPGSSPVLVPLRPHSGSVVPPSFQEFRADGKSYMVDYKHHLPSTSGSVFKGTITSDGGATNRVVVIKFTATYCPYAHQILADAQLAPHLRFCEQVESVGMFVVVMDYEDGVCAKRLENQEHIEHLRMAVEMLHKEDYVHGDIRGPNVLITTSGLKLIDFDWCGKEGEVRYPADISLTSGLPWHGEVRRGGMIKKDHDKHMVTQLT